MFQSAEKQSADLCVAPMASSDIYGKHEFTSSGILLRRKIIDKFDTDLIWNGAVTNKLFLKKKVIGHDHKFRQFGKAREAAFTVEFALMSDAISACSKGSVCYVSSVINDGVAPFAIEDYISGYEYIVKKARCGQSHLAFFFELR